MYIPAVGIVLMLVIFLEGAHRVLLEYARVNPQIISDTAESLSMMLAPME